MKLGLESEGLGFVFIAADIIQSRILLANLLYKKDKGRSIFVPPAIAHGMWLEFRQDDGG